MSNRILNPIMIKTFFNYRIYLPLFGLLFYGCSGAAATIQTYVNPSLNSSKITSVSVFPLNNAFLQQSDSLGTGDMIEINRMFQMEFARKNSKTKILDPVSSTELLKKGDLVNPYDALLRDYYTNTNIPNAQTLKSIGQNLGVDAIIQGFVVGVFQRDGVFGSYQIPASRGETKVTIKYVMFSTMSGDVLWEATCQGYDSVTPFQKAPPISKMIEMIKDKLVSALPAL
ncbi:MAG: hypothetical protein Q8P51_02655 [Ignavibacteria bacterium]|nr:hypothetical protein [Ignavibacteria bacterium]